MTVNVTMLARRSLPGRWAAPELWLRFGISFGLVLDFAVQGYVADHRGQAPMSLGPKAKIPPHLHFTESRRRLPRLVRRPGKRYSKSSSRNA